MSEQLVVRIGAQVNDPVLWGIWSSSEDSLIASGQIDNVDELATLSERAGQRPIIALLPSEDIQTHSVELATKPSSKILAALPFMLEDDIAGDIDEQFFAYHRYVDGAQEVAVVNRDKMQYWVNLFTDAGLVCERMIPAALVLPSYDSQISGLQVDSNWLFKLDDWRYVSGDLDWVLPVLKQDSQHQETELSIRLHTDQEMPDVFADTETQIEPAEMPIAVLASGANQQSFNLLQGEFKIKRQMSSEVKQWGWVAGLAVVALLLNVLLKGIDAYQLSQEVDELSQQITSEYKKAFPRGRASEGIMRRQIAKELEKIGGGNTKATFLSLLTDISPAFSEHQVKPQTMKFDSKRNELRIQAVGKDFRSLEQFKNSVQQLGYEVTQGAINNKDDFVVGSVSIRS